MNQKGPDNKGSKTGRKLGNCDLSEAESSTQGELGKGMGKARHSTNKAGYGKRKKHYLEKDIISDENDCDSKE